MMRVSFLLYSAISDSKIKHTNKKCCDLNEVTLGQSILYYNLISLSAHQQRKTAIICKNVETHQNQYCCCCVFFYVFKISLLNRNDKIFMKTINIFNEHEN